MNRWAAIFCAVTLVFASACGSDSNTGGSTSGTASVPGTTYSGVLDDGSVVSMAVSSTAAAALVADRALTGTTYAVTGTLVTAGGASYAVTGTYDSSTGKFQITAGPYTLSGTYTSGAFTGTYTGPNGSGALAAAGGASVSVTRYCGTYSGSGQSGALMVLVAGQRAFLAVKKTAAEGTVSGSTVTFSVAATADHPKIDVTGTIGGSAIQGQWTASDSSGTGTGTWNADSTKCGSTSSGTTNTQCNAIAGVWNVGNTTGENPSNDTCRAFLAAAGGTIGHAATATVTTQGSTVTVSANGDVLTGTLDATTCKVSLSTLPISGTVTINGASVAVSGTQKNEVTFGSNSSLTNAWTVTITGATGLSGAVLPCTVTATQTGSK